MRLGIVRAADFETDAEGGCRLSDNRLLRRCLGRFRSALGSPLPVELGAPYASCRKAMVALVDALVRSLASGSPPDWRLA